MAPDFACTVATIKKTALIIVPVGHAAYHNAMILLIDNYDSFTYNLVQRIGEIDPVLDVRVFRNDKITRVLGRFASCVDAG